MSSFLYLTVKNLITEVSTLILFLISLIVVLLPQIYNE